MLRRTPLRVKPADPQAERQERERNRFVRERAGYVCEAGCNRLVSAIPPHHAFRRNRVASELANDPACLVALCIRCHDAIHAGDTALDDRIMALAVHRLTGAPLGSGENAMDAVRQIERERGLR